MDYDSLRMVLHKYWPHGEVQRLVTGYDAYGRIDDLRGAIDTVTCEAGFFNVSGALRLVQTLESFGFHRMRL